MLRARPLASLALGLTTVLALTACSGGSAPVDPDREVLSPAEDGAGHTHADGSGGAIVGDGVASSAGGYQLVDVALPRRADAPGDVTFTIEDDGGRVVTDFTEEQTKLLHLYVVRDDLRDFRHLHPTMADDGTWTARLDLADPGRYRVITEFVAADGAEDKHVVLSRPVVVPGAWQPEVVDAASTSDDGVVQVTAPETMTAGPDERMTLTVSDGDAGLLNMGTFLGAYAHMTGFNVDTGSFVHVHPFGTPETTDEGTELTFHTEFDQPGTYRFFVQVRVDGFVHTVPVTSTVAEA